MRLIRAFAVLSLSSVLSAKTQAQTSCTVLSGLVLDSTGALIPGARIDLDGRASRVSGPDGRFRFPCVSSGNHTLTAEAISFAASTTHFKAPHSSPISFHLIPTTEASVTVNADENDGQVSSPGGGNGVVVGGRQLEALADDPDDLLREIQQLAAGSGGSPAHTTVSIDGFQDSAQLPPKDSIAFINVSPDIFSAEYSEPPFGGGRVEVYTKPGAKRFHGALFTTNSSSWMNARDPFSTAAGTIGKQRYGFSLSGPVRKQGSNFSLTLDHRSINEIAVVNAVVFNSTGTTTSQVQNVSQPQSLWIGQARMDWQLGAKNSAFVTYSAFANSLTNMGVGGTVLQEAGYDQAFQDHTIRLSDVTVISPKLVHEARVSFEEYLETDEPHSTAPSIQVSGYFTGGGASIGNSRHRRYKVELDDDVVVNTKIHLIKTGLQFFDVRRNTDLRQSFNGAYVFTTAQQYLTGTPEEFSDVAGDPNICFNQVRAAFFYQDNWKLSERLTFSYGLRYFFETLPGNYKNIAPRMGFIYTPDRKKHLILKTHFGLFNDEYSADDAQELLREDGVHRITSLVYNPIYGNPFQGATPILAKRTLTHGSTNETSAIGDFSISHDLPFGFNINFEEVLLRYFTAARTVNINSPLTTSPYGPRPLASNLNILQLNNDGTGQGHSESFSLSNFRQKRAQFVIGISHQDIRDNTDNSGFFQPQSAYTDAGEQARRDDQGLWQVFGNANISLPLKLSLSANGFAQGGKPFNLITGADNNGDGDFNDRPQFAAQGSVANGTTVFNTPFGLMTNAGTITSGVPLRPIQRNLGQLPWTFHLDANLQRAFPLTRNPKADHHQTLTANIRSVNFLNHTNITTEGNVLGSPQFLIPIAADTARRIEGGLRYSF